MRTSHTMLGFAAGIATAAAIGWVGSDAFAQLAGDQPVIYVCAAADGMLRLVAPGASCPAGQRSLRLKRAEADLEPPKTDEETGKQACTGADARRLAELEQRLKDLEDTTDRGAVTSRVTEPFEVVDRQGRKIFSVVHEDDTPSNVLRLFNVSDPKGVAQIRANPGGGYFLGRSSAGKLYAAIGAGQDAVSVVIGDDSDTTGRETRDRIALGRDPEHGNYRLKIASASGVPLAQIGEFLETHGGLAAIYDEKGQWRTGMFYSDNKGVLTVRGGGGNANIIATLSEGANGGGRLQLMSANGEKMVEAGVTAEHFGVVRAGPESFKPGMGVLGLPGSYIAGKPN